MTENEVRSKRYVVAMEDKPYPQGVVLAKNSITMKRDYVPVFYGRDDSMPIGWAKHIQRETFPDGTNVTMEITFAEKYVFIIHDELALEFSGSMLILQQEPVKDGFRLVTAADLGSVSAILDPNRAFDIRAR